MLAKYKFHETKQGTPIVHFKCAFCGKEGVRRASKVKNPNLVFCDNTCQMMYRHRKKRVLKEPDWNEIKAFVKENNDFLERTISGAFSSLHGRIPYDELRRESTYLIFHSMRISRCKKYITKTVKLGLRAYYFKFFMPRSKTEMRMTDTLDFSTSEFNQAVEDFDFKSVNLADIDELLAKKKRTCYALLRMYLDGFTTSEIADKLNIKEHNVSSSVSYAVKKLKSEIKD